MSVRTFRTDQGLSNNAKEEERLRLLLLGMRERLWLLH